MHSHAWHRQRGAPIDVHVLVHHGLARPAWLDRCLASLENEPVNVLLVHDDDTHIGAARARAFAACAAPFCAVVDDDDYVAPGAFDACLAAFDDHIAGVATDWIIVDEAGVELERSHRPQWNRAKHRFAPTSVLHLRVMRTEVVQRCLPVLADFDVLDCIALGTAVARQGDWKKIDVHGYYKTHHDNGASRRHSIVHWHKNDVIARALQ